MDVVNDVVPSFVRDSGEKSAPRSEHLKGGLVGMEEVSFTMKRGDATSRDAIPTGKACKVCRLEFVQKGCDSHIGAPDFLEQKVSVLLSCLANDPHFGSSEPPIIN